MKKALVIDNKVIQVEQHIFPVAAPLLWVDCPDDTVVGATVSGSTVTNPTPEPEPTIEVLKAEKFANLAAHRYGWETGGFTLGNMKIATDDRSKNLLTGARIAADANPNYTIDWKTENGWVTLSSAQIIAISNAVRDFVQACFNAEKVHYTAIAALTTKQEVQSYDISANWP